MDEAVLKRIDYLLNIAETQFISWDIKNLYWTLRALRRQIDSKLKKNEKDDIEKKLKELEKYRKKYLEAKELKGEYWFKCEEFYIELMRLMKAHGLFFRESDDPRYAVLQR